MTSAIRSRAISSAWSPPNSLRTVRSMASRPSSTSTSSKTCESMPAEPLPPSPAIGPIPLQALEGDAAAQCAESPAVATQQGQAQTARHTQCGAGIDVRIAVPVPTRPEAEGEHFRRHFRGHSRGTCNPKGQCRQCLKKDMLQVPALAHRLFVWRRSLSLEERGQTQLMQQSGRFEIACLHLFRQVGQPNAVPG